MIMMIVIMMITMMSLMMMMMKMSYPGIVTLNIHQSKYRPEEGQKTRLPESASHIVNLFLQIYISRM